MTGRTGQAAISHAVPSFFSHFIFERVGERSTDLVSIKIKIIVNVIIGLLKIARVAETCFPVIDGVEAFVPAEVKVDPEISHPVSHSETVRRPPKIAMPPYLHLFQTVPRIGLGDVPAEG